MTSLFCRTNPHEELGGIMVSNVESRRIDDHRNPILFDARNGLKTASVNIGEQGGLQKKKVAAVPSLDYDLLYSRVDSLRKFGVPHVVITALKGKARIFWVQTLSATKPADLLKVKGIGPKIIEHVKRVLGSRGIPFG